MKTKVTDKNSTRRKIITAAKKEFSKHGLAGARVDRIAEKARVNKAMLYYHFTSKENLFYSVIEEFYSGVSERHHEWLDSDKSLENKLGDAAGAFADIFSKNSDFVPILLRALADRDPRLLDKIAKIILATKLPEELSLLFDDSKKKGDTRQLDTRLVVLTFLSMNIGFHLLAPLFQRVFKINDYNKFLENLNSTGIKIFLHGLNKNCDEKKKPKSNKAKKIGTNKRRRDKLS